MGAIALSVRGLVEPGEASREQIDKDTDKVLDKAYQQMAENHKTNLKLAGELQNASDVYEMGDKPWPTLIDGHVHVAIPDVIDHAGAVVYPGKVELNPKRQDAAFRDMQIGSNIAYNPSPVIWPAPILAYSGIGSKSVAGEDSGLDRPSDLPGAMLGLCEADRLPVYISRSSPGSGTRRRSSWRRRHGRRQDHPVPLPGRPVGAPGGPRPSGAHHPRLVRRPEAQLGRLRPVRQVHARQGVQPRRPECGGHPRRGQVHA